MCSFRCINLFSSQYRLVTDGQSKYCNPPLYVPFVRLPLIEVSTEAKITQCSTHKPKQHPLTVYPIMGERRQLASCAHMRLMTIDANWCH